MNQEHQPNTTFTPAQTPQALDIQNAALWVGGKIGTGLDAEDMILLKNMLLSQAAQVEIVETLHFNHVRDLCDPPVRVQDLPVLVNNPLGLALSMPIEDTDKPPLLFLCCPYSHEDAAVRDLRALNASEATAILMAKGYSVFSPISHGHPVCTIGTLPVGTCAVTWAHLNNSIMALCHALVLLDIDGLWNSKGCEAEARLAHELGLPLNLIRLSNSGIGLLDVEADIDSRRFYTGGL